MRRLRFFHPFVLAALLVVPAIGRSQNTAKIVGGVKAPADTYRWIVALAGTTGGSLFNRQFCGASLIDRDWVLTAAHCVEGEAPTGLQVVVGLTDLDDTSNAQIRSVRGVYIHPGFIDRNGDLFSDIALLLLDAPVTTITPIKYATSATTAIPGTSVRALGWGDTQSTPRYPTELRMVDLDLVTIPAARQHYGQLDSRHLAARMDGKDTCSGDSGGPLFDLDGSAGSNPLLLGLTSYGIDCARKNIPGIYTNVGYFAPWIDSFLAQPTTGDPEFSVRGRGFEIPAGARTASRRTGTHYGSPVRAGRSRVRRFLVSNGTAGVPLSINIIRSTGSAFQVNSVPNYLFQGGSGVLSVRFRAPVTYRRGVSRSKLRIVTNDPATPVYSFNLLAKFKAAR